MRLNRCCGFLFASGLFAAVAGADTKLNSDTSPHYRKQWAVVIGINYEGRDDVRAAGVSPLRNAEADANAVAKVLAKDFGYRDTGEDQTLFVLLGQQATKREIERLFGKSFLKDGDRVDRNDSVLVFFAGHGDREKRENLSQTLLYPYDVQAVDGKGVDDTSCISLGFVLEQFRFCSAKHKLLVLDSCHSGEVFRFQTRSTARYDFDPDLFNAEVTQALTASAGDQPAQDGDKHSPFTEALLEALEGKTVRSRVFGASALFSSIPPRVQQLNQQRGVPTRQTPRGGPLNGDGEFYFFRTTEVPTFEPDKIDPRRLALQTLPGLSGRWWFEETPWLVPSLRSDASTLESLPATVTVLKPTDEAVPENAASFLQSANVPEVRAKLRVSAEQYIAKRPQGERMALGALMQMTSENLNEEQITRLVGLFDRYPDAHLKAAVHHRLNRDDAGELYRAALDEYEKSGERTRGNPSIDNRGLMRLCWSDYGRYLLDTGYTIEARTALHNALSFDAETTPPVMFVVDNLLLKSQAESMAGEWSAAEQSLETAAKLATDALPTGHPMLAVVHDRFGWMNMDRWRLDQAKQHFQTALDIRKSAVEPDLATRIAILHNEHGLAMVDRFSGKIGDARTRYERLATSARGLATAAKSRNESELVYGRIANSLERLADCYLFATPPEPLEAYETVDRALRLCVQLSPQQQPRTRSRLLTKSAMALAMAGEPHQALEQLARVKSSDYLQLVGNQIQELDSYWNLAEGVAQLQLDPKAGHTALRSAIDAATTTTAGLAARRQQWEVALFACDVLVRSCVPSESADAQRDADRLLELGLSDFLNRSNLPYLRPYLNTGLKVKLASFDRLQSRNLGDTLLRAKVGDALQELPRDRSAVLFFLDEQDGYALVLPDRKQQAVKPTVVALPFGRGNLASAKLPAELEAMVEQLARPLDTYWSDTGVVPPITNEQFPFTDTGKWTLVETEAAK